jgi:hypothetical protein
MSLNELHRNADQFVFRFVGVGNETTIDDIGGARDHGQHGGDQSSRATFRAGERDALRAADRQERFGFGEQAIGDHARFPGKPRLKIDAGSGLAGKKPGGEVLIWAVSWWRSCDAA